MLKPGDPYTEVFDMARLLEIAELSKKYVSACALKSAHGIHSDLGINSAVMEGVPDGNFSDFEVSVWQMMNQLIRYGRYDIPEKMIHLQVGKEVV